jgi:hypothetical protein
MAISINKAFPFTKFKVSQLIQKVYSSNKKTETDTVTATDFEIFSQSISGNLVAAFIPGKLFRVYVSKDELPGVNEIKNDDKLIFEDGRKYKIEGYQLQESQPNFKPFWKLEVSQYA